MFRPRVRRSEETEMEFTPPPSASFGGPAGEESAQEAESHASAVADEAASTGMFSSSPFNWFGDLKNAILGEGRKSPGKFDDLQQEAMCT